MAEPRWVNAHIEIVIPLATVGVLAPAHRKLAVASDAKDEIIESLPESLEWMGVTVSCVDAPEETPDADRLLEEARGILRASAHFDRNSRIFDVVAELARLARHRNRGSGT